MGLKLQIVKNVRLKVKLRSGENNYYPEIEIDIWDRDIFEIEIEVEIEIIIISMILKLPEILEIMPTLQRSSEAKSTAPPLHWGQVIYPHHWP